MSRVERGIRINPTLFPERRRPNRVVKGTELVAGASLALAGTGIILVQAVEATVKLINESPDSLDTIGFSAKVLGGALVASFGDRLLDRARSDKDRKKPKLNRLVQEVRPNTLSGMGSVRPRTS